MLGSNSSAECWPAAESIATNKRESMRAIPSRYGMKSAGSTSSRWISSRVARYAMDPALHGRQQLFERGRAAKRLERMRRRAAYQHEPGDAAAVPAIRLERDLHAHRVADHDRALDQRVVENARDVVGEIFDRDRPRVARRRGAAVAAIMKMQTESIG
jgi:hypothetical protein